MPLFTLAEAAGILDPPLTEQQLRNIITALGWHHDDVRRNGHAGRPPVSAYTYDWAELADLHKALLPFMRGSRAA